MRLVGGNLALDFINTRSGPPTGVTIDDDILTAYSALAEWAHMAGLDLHVSEEGAAAVFDEYVRARQTLDEIFRAVATREAPGARDLRRLRSYEAEAIAHAQLIREANGHYTWTWQGDDCPRQLLHLVVHAAIQLLSAAAPERVKQCDGCRFLFYDESKNRGRRWCSMQDCGTEQKMRKYIEARRSRALA